MRPIAWKTHAKISILGHLACNQIKQDQRLGLTIGITWGEVLYSVSLLHSASEPRGERTRCARANPTSADPRQCVCRFHARSAIGTTMILMFARRIARLPLRSLLSRIRIEGS